MLTSATAVLERRTAITGGHVTHPYEAGWAAEAVFFVQTEGSHPPLLIQSQISPDGINWVNRGDPVVLEQESGIAAIELDHFGGWLRLAIDVGTAEDDARQATVLIHLALKG